MQASQSALPEATAQAAAQAAAAQAVARAEAEAIGNAGDQARAMFRHEVLAVVFQVRPCGGRDQRLEVLLWQRARPPFDGCWSLPGGPLGVDERLGTSLGRHLAVKVDLTNIAHLEQLETRSDPRRDPRGRVLATAYLALVATDVSPSVPADTAWQPVDLLPPVAFDHESIIESARDRLRAKLSYTNLGFALAPATFTITGLRGIYSAVLGYPVAATNLQRILARREVIEPTGETTAPTTSGGGRPPCTGSPTGRSGSPTRSPPSAHRVANPGGLAWTGESAFRINHASAPAAGVGRGWPAQGGGAAA